jgi:uroporphyrinogen-III synthase
MSFDGLRVLSLESRRANEMAVLIRNQAGVPILAPSMREVPIEENQDAFAFASALFAGAFDMVILLTGVGTRYLDKVIATQYPPEKFAEALMRTQVVARGPKPMAVLREWKVPATLVPEPNTWREILKTVAPIPARNVAVQEYGRTNPELTAGLIAQGRDVTAVPVYQWALPLDTAPLRAAAHSLAKGEIDVAMFTTSIQISHLFQLAEEEGIAAQTKSALQRAVIASIGPTTSEALVEYGLYPDFEPSHPKMGNLVLEAGQQAAAILSAKRDAKRS